MKFLLGVATLLLSISANGGEIYKCKGKNGEIVLTNMQCPDAKSTEHLGSYQAVHDDPRSQQQAAQPLSESSGVGFIASQNDVSDEEPAQSSGYRNDLSEHYRRKNDRHTGPAAVQNDTGGYANDLAARYGNHDHAPIAEPAPNLGAYREPAQNLKMVPSSQPPSAPTDCHSAPAGNITCYDDKGSISYGHIDPASRSAKVYDDKGHMTDFQRQPISGALKSDNGTCVKNAYGECQ